MTDPIAYVYILAKDLELEFAPPIKVGVSRNPYKRAAHLSTSCPFEVGLYVTIQMPNMIVATEWERTLHGALEEWHLRGEWFNISPLEAFEKILWMLMESLSNSAGISRLEALNHLRTICK